MAREVFQVADTISCVSWKSKVPPSASGVLPSFFQDGTVEDKCEFKTCSPG